jgi:hypothetical protein
MHRKRPDGPPADRRRPLCQQMRQRRERLSVGTVTMATLPTDDRCGSHRAAGVRMGRINAKHQCRKSLAISLQRNWHAKSPASYGSCAGSACPPSTRPLRTLPTTERSRRKWGQRGVIGHDLAVTYLSDLSRSQIVTRSTPHSAIRTLWRCRRRSRRRGGSRTGTRLSGDVPSRRARGRATGPIPAADRPRTCAARPGRSGSGSRGRPGRPSLLRSG